MRGSIARQALSLLCRVNHMQPKSRFLFLDGLDRFLERLDERLRLRKGLLRQLEFADQHSVFIHHDHTITLFHNASRSLSCFRPLLNHDQPLGSDFSSTGECEGISGAGG